MFQFLYIFGPAAVTFLIVKQLTKKTSDIAGSLIALLAYAAIDAGLTMLILRPFGLVELITVDSGIRELRYGGTAYYVSLLLSIVMGLVIAAFVQRVDVEMTVTKKEKKRKNRNDDRSKGTKEEGQG